MNLSLKPANVTHSRTIEHMVAGMPAMDGAGVKLTRVLTPNLQRRLDPFLMLDNFRSEDPDDYVAGFPDHPHRGFETVTYMIAGRMRHRDSVGNEGLLQNGGVQWMTAGRGIIHSEMPEQENGVMEGFQLWLNLPARRKMIPAWYRDIPQEEVPHYLTELGISVRVIAGKTLGESRMGILTNTPVADGLAIYATVPAKALLIAGKPLGEAIMQHGPFVMNTKEEIHQAIRDYQEARLAIAG